MEVDVHLEEITSVCVGEKEKVCVWERGQEKAVFYLFILNEGKVFL